ncbi:STAS domain-containing protein [Olsenella sp. An188]|uniref:STAS domain-containing protein n=1 Tax=Olsenella sp. An188 TaxID=1965579 RepID=UPI000B383EA1|nr:STAS domain-containing protein [Olsenella sp. An188]OUP38852.1 anti-anti-sigma factor [Olsenella sp. An188]HJB55048.1 STAS domain-containing protein [Candidatus Olsenella avistercoris]
MSLSITVTNNVSSQTGAVESVVLVDGEVDVSNADQLRTVLDGRVEDAPTELVVDLSKVPYIDSTGIGVLVGAAHRAAEKNVRFEVANPQRNVERVLGLLGVSNDLNVRGA